jgi:hypothetical protein
LGYRIAFDDLENGPMRLELATSIEIGVMSSSTMDLAQKWRRPPSGRR